MRTCPCLEIDLEKIYHNAVKVVGWCSQAGVSVIGVTKGFCGYPRIAGVLMEAGVSGLADSRLPNLRRLRRGLGKVHLALLRGPMLSRAAEVVEYADVSFNTQLDREPGPPAD